MQKMKYHIITFGCQMNVSDSERMAGVFAEQNMQLVDSEKDADVVVINACSVRQKAIDRIWGKIKVFDQLNNKRSDRPLYTVLTGCVLPTDRPKFAARFDLYFPMKDLGELSQKLDEILLEKHLKENKTSRNSKIIRPSIEELLNDKQINYSSQPLNPIAQAPGSEEHYLQIKPIYTNKFSAYVPIMTGCNSFCTYCAVPYTRGREVSRKPEEIIDEVENLLKQSFKEITLLGQIINKYVMEVDDDFIKYLKQKLLAYDIDIKNIPELQESMLQEKHLFKFHHLLAVLAQLSGHYWLRFTSSHPKWFSEELIDTINRYNNIVEHIHLPVQAGSDAVLKKMLRPYKIADYKKIITYIREHVPNVAITSDVIVGFCGETEAEYKETEELFKWAKYDMAYISQYSTRLGTKAADEQTDDVPYETKVQRDKDLTLILKQTAFDNNQKYQNQILDVLITAIKKGRIIGRTRSNKNVIIQSDSGEPGLIGIFQKVKIINPQPWVLYGELV